MTKYEKIIYSEINDNMQVNSNLLDINWKAGLPEGSKMTEEVQQELLVLEAAH